MLEFYKHHPSCSNDGKRYNQPLDNSVVCGRKELIQFKSKLSAGLLIYLASPVLNLAGIQRQREPITAATPPTPVRSEGQPQH